ncbi:hypothetical protein AV530_008728 [Patagioenas fasciata monilis]|uniref:Uncharacterized protein n=1 Tax=Patagioenas fasciata monilis TaxID=372326 RepID=A0A1V4L1G9_PATFA|nr:hypothetical protein AV530_008728 [Patagioenas fasciata monilis]
MSTNSVVSNNEAIEPPKFFILPERVSTSDQAELLCRLPQPTIWPVAMYITSLTDGPDSELVPLKPIAFCSYGLPLRQQGPL